MKKDVLAFWLVGALLLSTLATAGLCYSFLRTSRALREMQNSLNEVTKRRQLMQSLAADLNEYGRTHPSIVPLLEQMNVKLRTAASTNVPGGRP